MSRGYSATPLWGLSRNSAVAGIFFVKISRLRIVRISQYEKIEGLPSSNVSSQLSVYVMPRIKNSKKKMAGVLNAIRARERERVHGEEIVQHFLIFFATAQEEREFIKNRELNLYVSRDRLYHRTRKLSYLGEHSEVSQARPFTRANQERCIMRDQKQQKTPKHKLSQNPKNVQCLLKFGIVEDNVTVFNDSEIQNPGSQLINCGPEKN